MAEGRGDLGYYALPVIPSFENGDKAVNDGMGKILGRLGDLSKRSGKDLGKGLGDGLKSAEAEVKKATDAYEKLRDRALDYADKVRVAESGLNDLREKGVTSGQRYDRALAAVAKAKRDDVRASKAAADALKDYELGMKRVESAGDSLGDKLRSLGDSAGPFGQGVADGFAEGFGGAASIARLGAAGGPVGVALAGLAAVGFAAGKALGPAIAEGLASEQLEDLYAARLGVDSDAMERLGGGAGLAYAHGFGASLADNLETTQAALRAGLLSPDAAEGAAADLVEQLQGLSMVTEASASELSRSIATLMRTGLAGSISEASDIITAGFQKGLDVSGDWLDTVNEYSTQARKFGLDAGEYMTLLSQGLKGGARDTDKVADALKEFSIRAVDGSKTTREGFEALGLSADDMAGRFAAGGDSAKVALNATFDALKRVDDPMQQALIWQRLFGTQWEDMGEAVNQFNLDPAKNEFKDLQGASERSTKAATDNFKSEWESATAAVSHWFADLKTDIADWFTDLPVIRDLPDMIQSVFDPTYFDIKSHGGTPGTPLTPQGVLDTLGGTGSTGAGTLNDLLLPLGGTPMPAPPAAPTPGARTPILTDAQAQAAKDAADAIGKSKPPPLFPNGIPSLSGSGLWDKVAQAESSGNWQDDNTGGHMTSSGAPRGGLQITDGTWKAFGGTEFATTANLATREQQIAVAERIAWKGYNGTPPQGLQAWEAITKGSVPGVTANTPQSASGTTSGPDFGARNAAPTVPPPDEQSLRAWVEQNFGIKSTFGTGSWENASHDYDKGWHHMGQNLVPGGVKSGYGFDFSGTREQMDALANWIANNMVGQTLELIYQSPGFDPANLIKNAQRGTGAYGADLLAQHASHVHWATTAAPGMSPQLDAFGSSASSPIDLSRNTTPGYGPGVPGFDENGTRGYWRADPKAVREADQRAADALVRITDADTAVALALARVNELDADASESQRLSALQSVKQAQDDAARARREADDAQADAAEARKGKFTEEKAAKDRKASGKGDFDDLGGILGSFMKETFGLDGSLFPDISDLPAVKSLGAVLGFAKNVAGAAADQGAQTSTAGATDPFSGMADTGAGTSGLPFGMIPGVSSLLPTSPTDPSAPTVHTGGGTAPGPVDQSTHVTINNPQGDEQSIADRTRRTILKTPRLGTYSAPAQIGVG
jgi:phage-related minor tail protein